MILEMEFSVSDQSKYEPLLAIRIDRRPQVRIKLEAAYLVKKGWEAG